MSTVACGGGGARVQVHFPGELAQRQFEVHRIDVENPVIELEAEGQRLDG
jgi:hypothetical protein